MNKSIYRISLDIHDTGSQVSLPVKRGDTARSIHITLTEKGRPYKIAEGCFAALSGEKADGNFLYNNCIVKDNVIIYNFTKQTTPVVGKVDCEVNLYDANGDNITSPHFVLIVEDRVYNGEEIESSPEATALIQAVFQAEESAEEAKGYRNETATMLDDFNGIQLWQPKTEYKVDDVVVADFAEILEFEDNNFDPKVPLRTFVVKCIKKHTSDNWFNLDNYIEEEDSFATTWEVMQETYAYYDALGRGIHNTYATKDELTAAIGEALEGDY